MSVRACWLSFIGLLGDGVLSGSVLLLYARVRLAVLAATRAVERAYLTGRPDSDRITPSAPAPWRGPAWPRRVSPISPRLASPRLASPRLASPPARRRLAAPRLDQSAVPALPPSPPISQQSPPITIASPPISTPPPPIASNQLQPSSLPFHLLRPPPTSSHRLTQGTAWPG